MVRVEGLEPSRMYKLLWILSPVCLPIPPHPHIGSSSWARTSDIVINSHALCQLSYRGIYFQFWKISSNIGFVILLSNKLNFQGCFVDGCPAN